MAALLPEIFEEFAPNAFMSALGPVGGAFCVCKTEMRALGPVGGVVDFGVIDLGPVGGAADFGATGGIDVLGPVVGVFAFCAVRGVLDADTVDPIGVEFWLAGVEDFEVASCKLATFGAAMVALEPPALISMEFPAFGPAPLDLATLGISLSIAEGEGAGFVDREDEAWDGVGFLG